jgi:hypothetical protein
MGYREKHDVDVTLEHDGNIIHCNDPRGLKTARDYLKEVSA